MIPLSYDSANELLGVAESIDLSAYAWSTVQVRFRYAGDGWNWWVQLDDVAVAGTADECSFMDSDLDGDIDLDDFWAFQQCFTGPGM